MKIHAGEAQVLDGEIAQPRKPLRGAQLAPRDRFQQLPYFFPIHWRTSLALPLRNP